MAADSEQLKRESIPPGARPIAATQPGRLRVPPIPVRSFEAADEPPALARVRFGWSVGEVSGSLGDLGNVPAAYRRRDHRRRHGTDRHPDDLWAFLRAVGSYLRRAYGRA